MPQLLPSHLRRTSLDGKEGVDDRLNTPKESAEGASAVCLPPQYFKPPLPSCSASSCSSSNSSSTPSSPLTESSLLFRSCPTSSQPHVDIRISASFTTTSSFCSSFTESTQLPFDSITANFTSISSSSSFSSSSLFLLTKSIFYLKNSVNLISTHANMGLQEALVSLKATHPDSILEKWNELEEAYDEEAEADMPCFQAWILAPDRVPRPILRLVAELMYEESYDSLSERTKKLASTLIKRLHLEGYWALFLGLGVHVMQSREALEVLARIMKHRPQTEFIQLLRALDAGRQTRRTVSLRGVSNDMSRFTAWDALRAEEILLGHHSPPTSHKAKSIGSSEVAAEDGVLTGLAKVEDDNASDHDQSMEFQGAIEAHLTRLRANDGSAEGEKHIDKTDAAEEEDDDHDHRPSREEESHDDDHEQSPYGQEGGHGDSDSKFEVEIGRGNINSFNPGNEDVFDISDLEAVPPYPFTGRESSPIPSSESPKSPPDSPLHAELLDLEDSQVVGAQSNSDMDDTVWIGASPITRQDMLTLAGENWLNDEVVNGLAKVLLAGRQDVHRMSTFFFALLSGTGDTISYAKVEKWTKRVDIFSKRYLVVPINKNGNHWTLAIITMAPLTGGTAPAFGICTVDSLDSAGGQSCALIANKLSAYLISEAKSKRGAVLSREQVKWKHARNAPQQANGYDCGVYMLVFLERFAKDPEHFLRTIEQEPAGSWVVDAASERARLHAMLQYQLQQATTIPKAVPRSEDDSYSVVSFLEASFSAMGDACDFRQALLLEGLPVLLAPISGEGFGSDDGRYFSSSSLETPFTAMGDACGSREASLAPSSPLPCPPASVSGEGSTWGSHRKSTSTKRVSVPDDSSRVPSAAPSVPKVDLTSLPGVSTDQTNVLPPTFAAQHAPMQNTADTPITQRLAIEHLARIESISLDRRQEELKSLPTDIYLVSCDQWAKVADMPALGNISTLLSTLDGLQAAKHVATLLISSSQSLQKRHHEESALEAQRLESRLVTQNARLAFAIHLVQVSHALLQALESFHVSQAQASTALRAQVMAEEAFRDTITQEKKFEFYREKWIVDVEARIEDLKVKCRHSTDEEMNMKRLYQRVLVVERNSSRIKEVCEERLGDARAGVAGFLKCEEEEEEEWAKRKRRAERLKELLHTSQV